MSLMAEALARSGALGAASMASVVAFDALAEPAVMAHPLAVRSGQRLHVAVLERALTMDPPTHVVDELLNLLPAPLVVSLADTVSSPRLLAELVELVAAGPVPGASLEPRWVHLRVGGPALRELAVVGLASHVGRSTLPGEVLTWLAAATSCPHLLAGLVDAVPDTMRATVARFAAVAAAGGTPVEVFASEVIGWVRSGGHEMADWVEPSWRMSAPTWPWVVHKTGLEQVAAGALGADFQVHAWLQVLCHPRLAGGPAHERARAWFATAMGEPDAPDTVVVDRAPLVAAAGVRRVTEWLAVERQGGGDVAFAWAMLRRIVRDAQDPRGLTRVTTGGALVAAMQLVCMDTPGGSVAGEALAWVQEMVDQVELDTTQEMTLQVLVQVADVVHHGANAGALAVHDLAGVRSVLHGWSWMGALVAGFLAGVPGVDDPVFVQGLLAPGDVFRGSLDDLVAVAAALAA